MTEIITIMGAAVALAIGLLTLIGFVVRYVLLPYFKEHVAGPAAEALNEIRDDIRAMARAYDGHLEWSQGEVDRIWRAVDALTETVTKLMKGKS